MARERQAIADPLTLDLSGTTCPPPRMVLQTSIEHVGIVEQDENTTTCSTPWFVQWQSLVELDGAPTYSQTVLCHYLFPATDDVDLLVAGLDSIPDWFFKFLSGADFGDKLTLHMALQWPRIFDYFCASTEQRMDRRFLMIVRTCHGDSWCLAEPLRGGRRKNAPAYLREDLMMSAVDIALRMSAPWKTLPQFIPILGGPDRVSRRLRAASGLFGSLSDAGGALSRDGSFTDLADFASALSEMPRQIQDLRD